MAASQMLDNVSIGGVTLLKPTTVNAMEVFQVPFVVFQNSNGLVSLNLSGH